MAFEEMDEMQEQVSAAAEIAFPDIDVTFYPMFGGACAYARGRVFALLFDFGLGLKLSPADRAELLALPDAHPLRFGPDGPESRQYIAVPPDMAADANTFAPWVRRSIAFAATQPAPKPRKKQGARF